MEVATGERLGRCCKMDNEKGHKSDEEHAVKGEVEHRLAGGEDDRVRVQTIDRSSRCG